MFFLCKPVSSKKRFQTFRKLNEEFSFMLFEKAEHIPAQDWESITGKQTIFLEKDFLKIVEQGEHSKIMCRFAIVYHKQKPCGILYFQIIDFKAGTISEILNKEKSLNKNLFERYIHSNKEEVLLRLFTCGNNLVSGKYGFLFSEKIKERQAHELLLEITELVSKEEKLRSTISAILIKDFFSPLQPKSLFKQARYSDFLVEPNMVVNIPENINSLNEYIELFSKKYRSRAKSVFKSFSGVEEKYLSLDEIKSSEKTLYDLYENIFEKAKFKLIKLPKNYFSAAKEKFENEFLVKAFFLNGKIVAFASSFLMPDNSLEAHYIGFDYSLNNEYNLYQNILYSMINEGIKHKRTKVNLGRTAAEIKTTVGAKAEDLICYIKPQNTISKLIQKPFISFLQPAEWTPRNPFKETEQKTTNQI